MKKKIVLFSLIMVILTLSFFATVFTIKIVNIKNQALSIEQTLGVWWWSEENSEEYLNFAKKNGVDEIYYCNTSFDENTAKFIKNANKLNIKVFALWGEKEWCNDRTNFDVLMQKYLSFNQNNTAKFNGVHLDIEPHQFEDFKDNRNNYLLKLVDFVYKTKEMYGEIEFHYDIPFWFDDEVKHEETTKKVYEHIIDCCSKVVVMSYRDTAEKIYSISKDEIEYANSAGKQISVSVNMTSNEGDNVSFQEENKEVLNTELEKLSSVISINFSVAIHHIKTWYNLPHGIKVLGL